MSSVLFLLDFKQTLIFLQTLVKIPNTKLRKSIEQGSSCSVGPGVRAGTGFHDDANRRFLQL